VRAPFPIPAHGFLVEIERRGDFVVGHPGKVFISTTCTRRGSSRAISCNASSTRTTSTSPSARLQANRHHRNPLCVSAAPFGELLARKIDKIERITRAE